MKSDIRTSWLIAIALTGWLLYLLAPVLTPFVAAGLLAYIGDPLADRLQRLKMPRTVAVVCVFLLTFLFVGFLIMLVLPLVRTQVGALFNALPAIVAEIEDVWLPKLGSFLGTAPGEDFGVAAFVSRYSDMAGSWGTALLLSVGKSGGALAAAVISLFLVPIITFYLLRDWDFIMSRFAALIKGVAASGGAVAARQHDSQWRRECGCGEGEGRFPVRGSARARSMASRSCFAFLLALIVSGDSCGVAGR
jgi:predicted PurR-regulated permease PerM